MLGLLYAGQVRFLILFIKYHNDRTPVFMCQFFYGYSEQMDIDRAPLYYAAKELINMQLKTGEFPQQVSINSVFEDRTSQNCSFLSDKIGFIADH